MHRVDPEAWEQLDPATRSVLKGFNRRYHHFTRRVVRGLVVLGVMLAASGLANVYLIDQNSKRGVEAKEQAYDSAFAACVSGSDLRILIADADDALRRGAVSGNEAPRDLLVQFYSRTQAPIDAVLTTAAYERGSGRTYYVRTFLGEVTGEVEREVRRLARRRCDTRTREQFPGVKPAAER